MTAAQVDLEPKRFTTDELPERERLTRWREEFGRTIVKVDIEPLSTEAPFKATAILQGVPGVGLSICDGDAASLHRTPALAADGDDSIGLIVNLGTPALASQRGADVMLDKGDGVFVLTNEPGVLRGCTHLSLVFPRAALALRFNHLEDAVMRSIPGNSEALQLLLRYLHFITDDVGRSPLALREAMIGHVHDLAVLTMQASSDTGERGKGAVAAARLQSIAKLHRLTATELRVLDTLLKVNGVRAMADTLGLSQATVKTHLHNLFRKTGTARQSDLVKLVAGM